ncbi:MAG: transposase family protein, partial [Clostridiales bacterium]|nr:transposase family protein [Clostridiales bacterium]
LDRRGDCVASIKFSANMPSVGADASHVQKKQRSQEGKFPAKLVESLRELYSQGSVFEGEGTAEVMDGLIKISARCRDKRGISNLMHNPGHVLVMVFVSLYEGKESLEGIHSHVKEQEAWFHEYLPLVFGIPSVKTISMVLSNSNADEVLDRMAAFVREKTTSQFEMLN